MTPSLNSDDQPRPGERRYERERKFLVGERSILKGVGWKLVRQGYVWDVESYSIRARAIQLPQRDGTYVDEEYGSITAKGPLYGDEKEEYEMYVPVDFAQEIIRRTETKITKRRYQLIRDGYTWDVDEFLDDNEGLVVAELEGHDIRELRPPDWLDREVTSDIRFSNPSLARNPISQWRDEAEWKPTAPWDWN